MSNVNWKIRFKNKAFLSSLIALLLVLANQIAGMFGVNIELISVEITNITETIFLILGLIGIINDPTTHGIIRDSELAMKYRLPRKDKK